MLRERRRDINLVARCFRRSVQRGSHLGDLNQPRPQRIQCHVRILNGVHDNRFDADLVERPILVEQAKHLFGARLRGGEVVNPRAGADCLGPVLGFERFGGNHKQAAGRETRRHGRRRTAQL